MAESPLVLEALRVGVTAPLAWTALAPGREHHQSLGLPARTQQRGRFCAAAAPVFSSPEARAPDEAFGEHLAWTTEI